MNDKELYGLILSNISIFKEKLLEIKSKNIVSSIKNPDKLVKDYLRVEKGVKIVSTSYTFRENILANNFIFSVESKNVILKLIEKDIPVFKFNTCDTCSDYFCELTYLHVVLEHFSSEIYEICVSKRCIPSSLFSKFIETIEVNIWHLKLGGVYNISSFVYEEFGIKEYGVFAYKYLYTYVIWDFEMVERYKDKLNWKLLIEYSNLVWDEYKLNRYFTYIPFNRKGDSYGARFRNTISNFSNIRILSNKFIIDNYRNINIINFLKTAHFTWSGEDLTFFYNLITSIDEPWGASFSDVKTGTQIFPIYCLCHNNNFIWTEDLLLSVFELKGDFNDFLSIDQDRREIIMPIFYQLFENNPSINKIIDTNLFLTKLIEGDKRPFNSYSIYFTAENIMRNWNNWNEILVNKFEHIHRLSRDTYYYVYKVRTMWNFFNENKHVLLSYDICEILMGKNIIVGGEYEKECDYQEYLDSGFVTAEIDALDFFADHDIQVESLEKILLNKNLTEILLKKRNKTLIEYILQRFFCDYSPEDFFSAIKYLE